MEVGDVEDLLAPPAPPQQPPVDPAKMADVQHKNAKLQSDAAAKAQDNQTELQIEQLRLQDKREERESAERVAQIEQQTERLRLAGTYAIHSDKIQSAERALTANIISDHFGKAQQLSHQAGQKDADRQHQVAMAKGGGVDGEKDKAE